MEQKEKKEKKGEGFWSLLAEKLGFFHQFPPQQPPYRYRASSFPTLPEIKNQERARQFSTTETKTPSSISHSNFIQGTPSSKVGAEILETSITSREFRSSSEPKPEPRGIGRLEDDSKGGIIYSDPLTLKCISWSAGDSNDTGSDDDPAAVVRIHNSS
jgi:hypothetical protein